MCRAYFVAEFLDHIVHGVDIIAEIFKGDIVSKDRPIFYDGNVSIGMIMFKCNAAISDLKNQVIIP